jgi:alpha-1,2-mannosyltransferase
MDLPHLADRSRPCDTDVVETPTEERLRLYPRALLVALAIAFALSLIGTGASTPTGRLGGDLPAFYGAGRIVLEGDAAHLYDWNRQATAELGLFPPDETEGFLAFAYPPFVAVAYAPLALLPFRLAYAVHTLFMVGCVGLTVALLARELPRIGRYGDALLAFAIGFHPAYRAAFGAQNSTWSTLLFVAAGALVTRGHEFAGGAVAGLLMFKPQLAVPLWGLFLLERRPRVLAGIATSATGLYLVGAAVQGLSWPAIWWREGVVPFQDYDQARNAPNCVGFLGFAENLFGVGNPVAQGIGVVLSVATIGALCFVWWRGTDADRTERIAFAAAGSLMIAPHAMFYDAALLTPALLVGLDRDRRLLPVIIALWLASHTHPVKSLLGFTPLFFVAAAALGIAIHTVLRARPTVR